MYNTRNKVVDYISTTLTSYDCDVTGGIHASLKMRKSEPTWSVQKRELFESNKVTLGISTLSLTISIIVLPITYMIHSPAQSQAYTSIKHDGRESMTSNPQKDVQSQTVAAHKNLLQAVERDPKFPSQYICLTHNVTNQVNEYTHGVTVTHDSLIMNFTGMYYIYCSIRFHQVEKASETIKYVTHVHRVSPYNPGGTGVLLKSVHTAVHKTTENTFTGGIFLLLEGDRIQACVTNEDVVDFKSESTFMGMVLLSSKPA